MAMMVKRKREEEKDTIKRLRIEETTTNATLVDRLTNLPESLQLRILSFLETEDAVKTMLLSKSWVSTWTCIPVLYFNSIYFRGFNGSLPDFDKLVSNVFSLREPVKLDKLTFERHGICSVEILKRVFDYAFSHGVRELQVLVNAEKDQNLPIWLNPSSDSLTSLRLKSNTLFGPRSGSFKNLTNLQLEDVTFVDLDPFSGFQALEKLRLRDCPLETKGNVLNVCAMRLSVLTIMYGRVFVKRCELTTPKLRCFNYLGPNFPQLKTQEVGLPILDTVAIDCNHFCGKNEEKKLLEDLLVFFNSLRNAESLTMFSSLFHLLTLFPDKLVNRSRPFHDLKCLKLDFSLLHFHKLFDGPCRSLSESLKHLPGLKAYLLQNSQDAKFTMIYPCKHIESTCRKLTVGGTCECVKVYMTGDIETPIWYN